MQQWRVRRVNSLVERAEYAIPLGVLRLGKHTTGKPGDDRQRDQQRRQYSVYNRDRQRTYVATSQTWQEQQREKGEDQRCRCAEDSDRDLSGRRNRGVTTRYTTPHESRDIFDHDNRIVDQET